MAVISAGLLEKLKFLPAILPDGTTLASLASGAGATPLATYGNLQESGLLTSLRDLQVYRAQTPGVTVSVQADNYSTPQIDSLALSLVDPRLDSHRAGADLSAAQSLAVNATNVTGAPVPLFWGNWTLAAERPSIAQKLKYPEFFTLTGDEQKLAAQMGLTGQNPRGVLPRTLAWIIENEYKTQIVDAVTLAQTLPVGATSAATLFIQEARRANEMLVLAGLAITAGSGADGLSLWIGVDTKNTFLQVPAYALGSGKPLRTFIQAGQQLKIQAASTSAIAAVSIAATIWHVRLTDEIRVRMGSLTSGPVFDKIQAGVL